MIDSDRQRSRLVSPDMRTFLAPDRPGDDAEARLTHPEVLRFKDRLRRLLWSLLGARRDGRSALAPWSRGSARRADDPD